MSKFILEANVSAGSFAWLGPDEHNNSEEDNRQVQEDESNSEMVYLVEGKSSEISQLGHPAKDLSLPATSSPSENL